MDARQNLRVSISNIHIDEHVTVLSMLVHCLSNHRPCYSIHCYLVFKAAGRLLDNLPFTQSGHQLLPAESFLPQNNMNTRLSSPYLLSVCCSCSKPSTFSHYKVRAKDVEVSNQLEP
eukprot:TRINITY_DN12260_c0_g2_i13.p5 TRINITY_DN12260_c0_g2~~TRINITY_DN12260_c0_g2_i13.p5  ORF type:complete len:117 (+),score=4.58 TRINITY_DN12260_c0_g2_i13:2073-2423(+)